jgi:hypothetical protein
MSLVLRIAGVAVEIHLLTHTHTYKFIVMFDLKSYWNAEVFRRCGME